MKRAIGYLLTSLSADGFRGKLALFRYYLYFLVVRLLRRVLPRLRTPEPRVARDVTIRSRIGVFRLRRDTADGWVVGGGYEPDVRRLLAQLLKPGHALVDVGAHIGLYSIFGARLVGPQGVVVAIEASPDNFEALVTNISLNGFSNVLAVNVACWSNDCTLELVASSRATGFWHRVRPAVGLGGGASRISGKRLDTLVQELRLDRIDLLKIDVEGASYEVLEGGRHVLGRPHPIHIVFEALSGGELAACSRVLHDLGFTVTPLSEKEYVASKA